jgi:tRNA G10  N-methylase Trm11
MTLLSDPPSDRPARPLRRHRAPAAPLLRAVIAAVATLDDVDYGASTLAARRHLDRMLRDALDRHLERVGDDGPVAGVPAVRVACAHLAAGDVEDAYLALLTARDLLR